MLAYNVPHGSFFVNICVIYIKLLLRFGVKPKLAYYTHSISLFDSQLSVHAVLMGLQWLT